MKTIIFLIILTLLISCRTKDKGLQEEINLTKWEQIVLDNVSNSNILFDPIGLVNIDSFLVINNSDLSNFIFTLIDYKNKKFIKHFGRKEKGPYANITGFYMAKSSIPRSFETYNVHTGEYLLFNIDSVLNSSKSFFEVIMDFDKSLTAETNTIENHPINVRLLEKNIFLAQEFLQDSTFSMYKGNNLIGEYVTYPKFKNLELTSEQRNNLPMVFQPHIKVNPNYKKNKFVYAYLHSDFLEICKYGQEGIKSIFNNYTYLPEINPENMRFTKKNKVGIFSLETTESNIYIQESNKTMAECFQNNKIIVDVPEIIVYDWNGKFKSKLKFSHDFRFFTVDDNNQFVFIIANIPEPTLLKYYLQ